MGPCCPIRGTGPAGRGDPAPWADAADTDRRGRRGQDHAGDGARRHRRGAHGAGAARRRLLRHRSGERGVGAGPGGHLAPGRRRSALDRRRQTRSCPADLAGRAAPGIPAGRTPESSKYVQYEDDSSARPAGRPTPRADPTRSTGQLLARDTDAALAGAAVVVVEGLFAERVAPRTRCARLDVFVDLAADLRLARKIERKVLRDGFPLEVLLSNYLAHRRDAHERHVEPARHRADLVVDGALAPGPLAGQIWAALPAST
ncbi:hypothetical protein OG455_02885 [Kitasatospora sp. NBC_01287]|uniref:hypothetical protein n=1 Tax=Kitasatospora sp. NBC_01287 TaxID=2903573 RepID=UPI0022595FEB|nr:hypothetical protein [Kitasatospora sp. NBC_01287]MCX4744473.1 hypothetical protein [Kitasatospora sp. NBC_01287]